MLRQNKHSNLSEIIKQLCFLIGVLLFTNILCAEKAFCQLTEEQAAVSTQTYSKAYKRIQNEIKKIENPNYELGTRDAAKEIKHHSKVTQNALDRALKKGKITRDEYAELQTIARNASNMSYNKNIEAAQEKGKKGVVRASKRKQYKTATKIYQECATSVQLKEKYLSMCWSCVVFNRLLTAFLNAADHGLNVTQRAGTVLLIIGSALWLVFWGLKNVSSFTEIQLANILNDLIKFFFKVMLAYWFIAYGTSAIGKYFVSPILSLGSTAAEAFIAGGINSSAKSASVIPAEEYTGSNRIISGKIMNSLLNAMRIISYNTSNEMILGNMLMCYSNQEEGGKWKIKFMWLFTVAKVPDIFIWLEGAILWCCGFMLTVAVSYYFLDISLKVGFAVLALPLVMGLWPFNITKDKLTLILSIIAKASASFAFMSITTWFGMELLYASLGGADEIFAHFDTIIFKDGDVKAANEMISNKTRIFSSNMLIILFAIIYFYKLVQNTTNDFVNKFFPDSAFGSASPMHNTATMFTSMAVSPLKKYGGLARDVAMHQAGIGAKKLGGAAMHPIRTAKNIGSSIKSGAQSAKKAAKGIGSVAKKAYNKVKGGGS